MHIKELNSSQLALSSAFFRCLRQDYGIRTTKERSGKSASKVKIQGKQTKRILLDCKQADSNYCYDSYFGFAHCGDCVSSSSRHRTSEK